MRTITGCICVALSSLAIGAVMIPAAGAAPSATSADHWGSFFGDNRLGESDTLRTPTNIVLPGTIEQIGTSNSTEYALLRNGTLWAWGDGLYGELGDGGTVDSYKTPVQVQFPAGVSIASIPTDAMPYDTGLAIDTSGNAWGWGKNLAGSLCLGDHSARSTPVRLPFQHVTALAGAGGHAYYVEGGKLYACGSDAYGELGDGAVDGTAQTPVAVSLPAGSVVTHTYASFRNGGALLSNGMYYDWGYDAAGQVGNATTASAVDVPFHVPLGHPTTQVALGGSFTTNGQTIVKLGDGTLRAWGNDADGALGDGQSGNYEASPIVVKPPAGITYETLASGGVDSYAITTTGVVYAWGANDQGQAGAGSNTANVLTPTAVDSGASLISATANNVAVAG
jgi:alpha-tubulin suppressor-like RCC1 family protein